MAVPTRPLWLGVILITGAQLTRANDANSSPPRKGEAIAFGWSALPLAGRREGRSACSPRVGERSSFAAPSKCHALLQPALPSHPSTGGSGASASLKAIGIGMGRFRIARESTRLDFAPMELVLAPPMGTVP